MNISHSLCIQEFIKIYPITLFRKYRKQCPAREKHTNLEIIFAIPCYIFTLFHSYTLSLLLLHCLIAIFLCFSDEITNQSQRKIYQWENFVNYFINSTFDAITRQQLVYWCRLAACETEVNSPRNVGVPTSVARIEFSCRLLKMFYDVTEWIKNDGNR